jgi:hypothetical protein
MISPVVPAQVWAASDKGRRTLGKRSGAQESLLPGGRSAARSGPTGSLGYLPEGDVARIRSDYRDMREMFFGEAPPFDRVIADLKELEEQVNS